jgi:hypothetical protein
MSASITIENNAQAPITSANFGSLTPGTTAIAYKYYLANVGDAVASSVQVQATRIASNDGVDYVQIAPDVAGNPGTYSANLLNVGTLAAGASYAFWVQVSVPNGVSPAGNPRLFSISASYSGT